MINIDTLLYVVTALTTISGFCFAVYKGITHYMRKTSKDVFDESLNEYVSKLEKKHEAHEERLDDIANKLAIIAEESRSSDRKQEEALLALSRDKLNQAYQYYMSKGCIGSHSLCVLEDIYASYKKLGGNTFIDRIMMELRELPIMNEESGDNQKIVASKYIRSIDDGGNNNE